uniref:AlNc14C834G12559 protein n=1 Tax=Albugo laibachii Nc14 TaxID=890382 RepID=F0X249_9STRA|nr:AlNc14C834G12559 [Albugo laibachii Nc14]|eukprot:CCA27922.1 AlNc14C834G12559 [Albugo laibachii Nc14]
MLKKIAINVWNGDQLHDLLCYMSRFEAVAASITLNDWAFRIVHLSQSEVRKVHSAHNVAIAQHDVTMAKFSCFRYFKYRICDLPLLWNKFRSHDCYIVWSPT